MDADWTGAPSDVLLEIFGWLGGPELRAVSAVCQRWRALTLCSSFWRRLLLAEGHLDLSIADEFQKYEWNWRNEYWRVHACWRLRSGSATPSVGVSPLLHVAFTNRAVPLLLAAAAQDGTITIWNEREQMENLWAERGALEVRALGWKHATFLQFSEDDELLLASGPLLGGSDGARGEIAIYRVQAEGHVDPRLQCRVWCGPTAAHGCWVDARRLLAPRRVRVGDGDALTELWLSAAEQQVHSENAPVMARMLRLYSVAGSAIRFLRVATVKTNVAEGRVESSESQWRRGSAEHTDCVGTGNSDHDSRGLRINFRHEYYYECLLKNDKLKAENNYRVLVYSCGIDRSAPHALALTRLPVQATDWPSSASTPISLASRRAERLAAAAAAAAVAVGALELDERQTRERLRASCTSPDALIDMAGVIVGLTLDSDDKCAWVLVREWEGAFARLTAVSLLSLREVGVARRLSLPSTSHFYYAFPSASDYFITVPSGGGREDADTVWVWTRAGAAAAELAHPARVSAAALAPPRAFPGCTRGPARLRHLCATAADDGGLRIWECYTPVPDPQPHHTACV